VVIPNPSRLSILVGVWESTVAGEESCMSISVLLSEVVVTSACWFESKRGVVGLGDSCLLASFTAAERGVCGGSSSTAT